MNFSQISVTLRRIVNPDITLHGHCDVPCGIYDPKDAQLAAETVEKMMTLMDGVDTNSVADKATRNSFIRYVAAKEVHAEKVKHEVRIIWGDYFKPEHLEKFPDLHAKVWQIMKTASACRQGADVADAANLRQQVDEFADMFWATKS